MGTPFDESTRSTFRNLAKKSKRCSVFIVLAFKNIKRIKPWKKFWERKHRKLREEQRRGRCWSRRARPQARWPLKPPRLAAHGSTPSDAWRRGRRGLRSQRWVRCRRWWRCMWRCRFSGLKIIEIKVLIITVECSTIFYFFTVVTHISKCIPMVPNTYERYAVPMYGT